MPSYERLKDKKGRGDPAGRPYNIMSRVYTPYAIGSDMVHRQKAYTKKDFVKTRVLFKILSLVAFMAILSLFYIWSRVQIVQYGYEINSLNDRRMSLLEENKKIKVEVATLKAPQRIEKIALEQLRMRAPDQTQIRSFP